MSPARVNPRLARVRGLRKLSSVTATPRHAERSNRNPRLIAIWVVIAALLVGLVTWGVLASRPDGSDPAAGGTVAATTPAVSPSDSATADVQLPDGCTAVDAGFVPERYSIDALDVDEPVIALDLDADGNIAAPPKDQARTASWWSGGPKPGSDAGQAVLSIHTYRNGGAVGNELFDGGKSALQAGDLLRLTGPDGQVLCYEYTDETHIAAADYDPDSDLMVDFDGDPKATIIICWDFNSKTEEWDSRVFFHFAPVTGSSAA